MRQTQATREPGHVSLSDRPQIELFPGIGNSKCEGNSKSEGMHVHAWHVLQQAHFSFHMQTSRQRSKECLAVNQ